MYERPGNWPFAFSAPFLNVLLFFLLVHSLHAHDMNLLRTLAFFALTLFLVLMYVNGAPAGETMTSFHFVSSPAFSARFSPQEYDGSALSLEKKLILQSSRHPSLTEATVRRNEVGARLDLYVLLYFSLGAADLIS